MGEQKAAAGLLRIAIVLDSYNVSAWIATAVDDLLGADFLEIAAVVLLPESKTAKIRDSRNWLFHKYAAWDARPERSQDDPLRIVDISPRFADVFRVSGVTIAEYDSIEDLPGDCSDVLIWLAPREPERADSKVARYGVWRYRQREPAHFWEIYEASPVTRSALEVRRDGADSAQVIYEAHSATVQGWSWQQNQSVPYRRASAFLLRALGRLHDDLDQGLGTVENLGADGMEPVREMAGTPTNWQVAGFLLRNMARTVSRRIRYAKKESHWFVAYRTGSKRFVSNREELDLSGFEQIRAPAGHFYADPFVIKWRDRNYLFVEDYLFAEGRGCISVMEIGSKGALGEAERVLDLPYHLSYPFVFEHAGELYMIPETLGAERIDLYRAENATAKWQFVKTLREGVQAVDTTLWVENGQFHFFTNIAERGATVNDDLYLFYADELLGEWKPHARNPIVTDVRRSRGAGRLFRRGGKLIRPGQDCSIRYGYACQLNEIQVLTPTEYRERPLARIEPDWAPGLIGTHTINSNEDFEVIDGQVYGKRYARKTEGGDQLRRK